MKKKIIWLIVAAALLAAMIFALVALNKAPEPAAASSSSAAVEQIYVTGGASAGVPSSVEISNETGRYKVINRAPEAGTTDLTIEGWEKFSLDNYGLGGIITNSAALAAKRVVSENPSADELAAYGLDKPRATVKIHNADGSSVTVLIGADAPGGEGVYVRRGDGGAVYLVTSTITDKYLCPDFDYISKTVTPTDPEYKGFERAVLSGSNYPEPITIIRTPETTVEAAGMSLHTHSIISPINVGLNSSKGVEALSTAYGITASKVVDVGDDAVTLAKYGLTEPAAEIAVTGVDAESSFTLRISATDGDGNVYLIKNGSPVIYQLSASTLAWLPLKLFDLMDRMAVVPNIVNVSQIKLTTPDKTYIFDLIGEDDALVINLNGEKLPDVKKEDGTAVDYVKNFRQLYQTMIGATYTDETELVPAVNEKPLVQIEYIYKESLDRDNDVISFYSGPTRKTVMVLNGGKPYLGSSVYLDRLIEDAAKVAAGQVVKAYI